MASWAANPTASPLSSGDYPRFVADAGWWLGPAGQPQVEVVVQLCDEGLHFEKDDKVFHASLEFALVLSDRRGRQVTGDTWRREVTAPTYEATRSRRDCVVEILALPVAPGVYTAAVTVSDRRSGERSRLEFRVRVGGDAPGPWHLTDLLFGQAAADSAGSSSRPGTGAAFLPHPSRVYGEEIPELLADFELYAAVGAASSLPSDLRVDYRVEDVEGKKVGEGRAELVSFSPGDGERPAVARFRIRRAVDSLGRGVYSLAVHCTGQGLGAKKLALRETFEVSGSRGFWHRDYLEAIETLRYIATTEEMAALRAALPDDRRAAWNAFWAKRDPTPGTARNEKEEEYMARVAYANHSFEVLNRPGWETDRGMIYILYGPPDDVERFTPRGGAVAGEVWQYFRGGRRFVFLDRTGLGDYELADGSSR